jgi:hypothetical protein
MIVVIYGSDQFPEQTVDGATAGFDKLVLNLRRDYPEVWPITPGENPSVGPRGIIPGVHIEVGGQQTAIQELIQNRVMNNPNLHFIILVGYSWGGGDVYTIAQWIAEQSDLNLKLAGAVYVDAIVPRSTISENRFPPEAEAMLNIYQSRGVDLHGLPIGINPWSIVDLKDITQVDYDRDGNFYDHRSIDERSLYDILSFIRSHVRVPSSD